MFYKNDYLTEQQKSEFVDSPEFSYVLYQKMKVVPNISLGSIQGLDSQGKMFFSMPTVLKISEEGSSYYTINGQYSLNSFSQKRLLERFQKNFPQITSINIQSQNLVAFLDTYPQLQPSQIKKSKQVLADFFNLKEQGTLTDKYNNIYHYKIIENADPTIGDIVVVDQLLLFKLKSPCSNKTHEQELYNSINGIEGSYNLEQVGYLKVKYTTNNIINTLQKDNLLSEANSSHKKNQNIPIRPDEIFLNTATIDFSRVEPEYQNKGLGYAMYFYMAQHLNKNGIEFRQSTMNSDSASRLWKGMEQHFSENVEIRSFLSKNLAFLAIGEDSTLSFNNLKPIISSSKKFTHKI